MSALHALLNVPPDAAIVIKQVELVDWGRGLTFALRADEKAYELRFEDCREMRWRIYAHETAGDDFEARAADGFSVRAAFVCWLLANYCPFFSSKPVRRMKARSCGDISTGYSVSSYASRMR